MEDKTKETETANTPPEEVLEETINTAGLLAKLKKLESDNAALMGRVRKSEEEKEARKKEELKKQGEFQKLADEYKAEKEALAKKIQEKDKFNAAVTALAGKGLTGEGLNTLAPLVTARLSVGDDGTVTGVEEAIEALEKGLPGIFKQPEGTGLPGAAGVKNVDSPDLESLKEKAFKGTEKDIFELLRASRNEHNKVRN